MARGKEIPFSKEVCLPCTGLRAYNLPPIEGQLYFIADTLVV